jgi:hypothetical protein
MIYLAALRPNSSPIRRLPQLMILVASGDTASTQEIDRSL